MHGPTTREELRELQRPFKERFADDPEAAQITLETRGRLTERYRAVFRTLAGLPSLSVSLERD